MSFKDYSDYDGLGLAELVKAGEVSPAEVTEAAIERVERHNPAINAVVHKGYDEARARRRAICRTGRSAACPSWSRTS